MFKLFLVLGLCTTLALALTANEAREKTKLKVDAYATATLLIDHVYTQITTHLDNKWNTGKCTDIQLDQRFDLAMFASGTRPDEPDAWLTEATRIWSMVKARLELDGFRIEADYLRDTVVNERPVYKQRYFDDGRVVAQEVVCAGRATPRGDPYYGLQRTECFQAPRITICWDT